MFRLVKRFITVPKLRITNKIFRIPGERKKRIVGRGGKKATAGRGRKGYKARSSKSRPVPAFAGGQTPITKAFRKFGKKKTRVLYRPIQLDKLQHWIDRKRIDPSKPITLREILNSNIAGRVKEGVVLLANGAEHFNTKVEIHVTSASQAAIQRIKDLVVLVYSDKQVIHATKNPEKYSFIPQEFIPRDPASIAKYSQENGFLHGRNIKEIVEKLKKVHLKQV